MEGKNKVHPAVAALIVIVLLTAGTVGIMSLDSDENISTESPSSSEIVTQSNTRTSVNEAKDGTYSAQGSYRTPGGTESIAITVTLKDSTITDIDLEQQASGGDTTVYQAKFASGYKPLVVGKKIDEVRLSRVAGSSLTSNGFNDALEQIRQDAAS